MVDGIGLVERVCTVRSELYWNANSVRAIARACSDGRGANRAKVLSLTSVNFSKQPTTDEFPSICTK